MTKFCLLTCLLICLLKQMSKCSALAFGGGEGRVGGGGGGGVGGWGRQLCQNLTNLLCGAVEGKSGPM